MLQTGQLLRQRASLISLPASNQLCSSLPSGRAAPQRAPCIRTFATAAGGAEERNGQSGKPSWEVRMLFDGECPLCMREVNFLRSRDSGVGKIDFVDIASPSYKPEENMGLTYEQAMERIHAITAEGEILRDVAVFRKLYQAVGLGWVYAITENPTIENLANKVYGIWAKYRMEVTGRESLPIILERHRRNRAGSTGSLCAENKNEGSAERPLSQASSEGK